VERAFGREEASGFLAAILGFGIHGVPETEVLSMNQLLDSLG
jgi:hypothetical protein